MQYALVIRNIILENIKKKNIALLGDDAEPVQCHRMNMCDPSSIWQLSVGELCLSIELRS